MRRLFGRLAVLGALAGGVALALGLLRRRVPGEEVVTITFDDNSTRSLISNTVEAQEFTDIARKVVEIGV